VVVFFFWNLLRAAFCLLRFPICQCAKPSPFSFILKFSSEAKTLDRKLNRPGSEATLTFFNFLLLAGDSNLASIYDFAQ
jgi:hypothetical protein